MNTNINIEENFLNALEDTRNKAHYMFSSHSYFPDYIDRNQFGEVNDFIHKSLDDCFYKCIQHISAHQDDFDKIFGILNTEIKKIIDELVNKNSEYCWIDVPISKLNNIYPYLYDNFTSFFSESSKKETSFLSIKSIKNYWQNILHRNEKSSALSPDSTYLELSEVFIKKMIQEWNLGSFQIMDDKSWYDNFLLIQHFYNTVNEAQNKSGLPSKNLGANQKLNIVLSNSFLYEMKWLGLQSKTNASFTIFINPNQLKLNKTWAHEYTHFLDRLAAYTYYKENNSILELSSFSHLALNCVINHQPIKSEALKIMAETISATVSGLSSKDFYEKINKNIADVNNDIKMKIIFAMLPEHEKTWTELSSTDTYILLNNQRIKSLSNFIMLQVSNHPKGSFGLTETDTLAAFEGNKVYDSNIFVPDIIHDIVNKMKIDQYSMHSNLMDYIQEYLFSDIQQIMSKHNLVIYKDHSIYDDRFFLSPGNDASKAAQKIQENDDNVKFSYYDKPLELLARMSENLQDPLMNNFEFKEWTKNESNNKFIEPILGKDERMMLCATLHSMARYSGIDVEHQELEHLICVLPRDLEETFHLQIENISDFEHAKPNQIIPDDNHKKFILQTIEKFRNNILEEENLQNIEAQ